MTERLSNFSQVYALALGRHLKEVDEASLSQAYELGRCALTEGFGVLDIVTIHQEVLVTALAAEAAPKWPQIARNAADFSRELLSPFEMSLRGYRDANAELLRLNATLEQQRLAVEAVNKELESFSYSVSHDLRAPLRSIDGFSQALYEDYGDKLDAEGKLFLQNMRESAQDMAKLIDDLLTLARVTRGDFKRVRVDLAYLARRIMARLSAAEPNRRVEVAIADVILGDGDARLLGVVLENLLSNAWKFTANKERGRIEFGLDQSSGQHVYFVRDNGAGFDMAYAAKLFGAFQRLHSTSEFPGTGIGLATVQRIIHRHEGKVWAEGAVDHGATFYFTLGSAGLVE